jgi:phosphoribosylglycinamide formyltransferase-1
MRIIALSSSRGTTFQAVLDAIASGFVQSPCIGLITDREDRGCIEKARNAGVPVEIVTQRTGETRDEYAKRVDAAVIALAGADASDVLLAACGWMWILPAWFTAKRRMLNVHPALLPKFGGKGMYGHHVHDAVLAAGEKESGVTIHLMDQGVDTGRILLQKRCPVLPGDTAATLQARVQELEKDWYPKALAMIERGEVRL